MRVDFFLVTQNKLERPPSPVKDESAAMDQLLDVDEDEKRRLGKEVRIGVTRGRLIKVISMNVFHSFEIQLNKVVDNRTSLCICMSLVLPSVDQETHWILFLRN